LDCYSAAVEELKSSENKSTYHKTMLSIAQCGLGASLLYTGKASLALVPLRKSVDELQQLLPLRSRQVECKDTPPPQQKGASSLHSHLLIGLRALLIALETNSAVETQEEAAAVCTAGIRFLLDADSVARISGDERLQALSRFHFSRAKLLLQSTNRNTSDVRDVEEVVADLAAAEQALVEINELTGAFHVAHETAMVLSRAVGGKDISRDTLAFTEMPFADGVTDTDECAAPHHRKRVAAAWRRVHCRAESLLVTAANANLIGEQERWVEEMLWGKVMEAGFHDEVCECLSPLDGAMVAASKYLGEKRTVSKRLAVLCGDICLQLCLGYVRLGEQAARAIEDGRLALRWYDIASPAAAPVAVVSVEGEERMVEELRERRARVWGLLALAAVHCGDLELSRESLFVLSAMEQAGCKEISGKP